MITYSDLKADHRGLFQDLISAFAWRDWEKTREFSVRTDAEPADVELSRPTLQLKRRAMPLCSVGVVLMAEFYYLKK